VFVHSNSGLTRAVAQYSLALEGFHLRAFLLNMVLSSGLAASAALFGASLWGVGRQVRGWLVRGRGSAVPFHELALGMAAYSLAVLGLGLAGLLYRSVFAALALPAIPALICLWRGRRPFTGAARWKPLLPGLFLLPALHTILASPLLPPLNVDVLVYHLAVPELWRMGHRIFAYPGNMTFSYPLGLERLVLPLLSFGVKGANVWLQLGLLALAALLVSRALSSAGSPHAGAAGWLVFGAAPSLQLALCGHQDTGMIFGVALAVHASVRSSAPGMAFACGFMMFAKYTGLEYAAAFLAAWAVAGPPGRRLRRTFGMAALATIPCLTWMARNWLETGNPLYPFLNAIFPSLHWTPWNTSKLWGIMRNATVLPDPSGPLGAAGGWLALAGKAATSAWFTPWVCLWCLVPFALLARGVPPAARRLAWPAALFAALWALPEPKVGRYLLPGSLMPLSIFILLLGGVPRRVVTACTCLLLLVHGMSVTGQNRSWVVAPEEVLSGNVAPAGYERVNLGAFAGMRDFVNAECRGRGRVLIIGEPGGFGLSRPWLVTDDTNIPAWKMAAGTVPDERRMRVAMRQADVRWVIYNPLRASRIGIYVDPLEMTLGWLKEWGGFWRKWATLLRSPRQFDWTGGVYLYGVRDSPAAAPKPQPFLPGSERFHLDVRGIVNGGKLDGPVWSFEREFMGDYGFSWYHRMLISAYVLKDRKRAVAEGEEAVKRGLDIPWNAGSIAHLLMQDGRPCEAIKWAAHAADLAPTDPLYGDLLRDARRDCVPK